MPKIVFQSHVFTLFYSFYAFQNMFVSIFEKSIVAAFWEKAHCLLLSC